MKMWAFFLLCVCVLWTGGCYSTRSGLPEHIHTIKVPVFKNKTEYYGLESKLTRAIIEKLNVDPAIRVVNDAQDATIYGEITSVQKRVLTETFNDKPTGMQLTITVKVFFRDEVQGTMLIDGVTLYSHHASSGAGQYDISRGQGRTDAETTALQELADEIVRGTIGMW